MKKICLIIFFASFCLVFLVFSGCANKKVNSTIPVSASILPQKYFIERIGGNKVSVEIMVKPGQNPATYEPTPEQIIKLSNSMLFFTIGVPFEKQFIPAIKSTIKNIKLVDTSIGVKKRYLEEHSHGEGEDMEIHTGGEDPHVWLSPLAVKIQAKNIFDSLLEIDPQNNEYYKKNLDDFFLDLDAIHEEIKAVLVPFKGRTIFVYHPAFGYFTDEFGLNQESIETGGKEPAPATMMEIINHALEENIKAIFVQPEFSKKNGEAVANAIGAKVVELNPLSPDYFNNLRKIAEEIKKSLL
ncbi:MAG: zinc ABC transporter substrate-binding protein [Spirochaetaceae bacterium]|nr:zinc ABC transporter substrate-binding protein [Spirochaetaceae bacterium]